MGSPDPMTDPPRADEPARPDGAPDVPTLVGLFDRHRDRLRRMVQVRLDRRLQGRIDPSDVLQEAQIDVLRRAGEYVAHPTMPPFLWLRYLTAQRLMIL